MKWTNRGHELDAVGLQYAKIRNLYIWGAGLNGQECYNFLNWLKVDKDLEIQFVDSDEKIQKVGCCSKKVISPNELFSRLSCDDENSISVVVVAIVKENEELMEMCVKKGVKHLFNNLVTSHRRTDNFIQHFICTWLLYKKGELLSHWMNYVVTTKCNLNCQGCANFTEYISNPKDIPLMDFQNHMDIIFSKYDYLYSFHFTGGEPLLYKNFVNLSAH